MHNRAIRIALVLGKVNCGGVETVVWNYCRELSNAKVHFDVFFDEHSAFVDRERWQSLGIGLYPVCSYTHLFAYVRQLKNIFQQKNYDIVHSHLSTMSVFPLFAAWRARVPVRICHNHSTNDWREGTKAFMKCALRPMAGLFATDLFACGQVAARWMYGDRLVESNRVKIISNAFDTTFYEFNPAARDAVRKELGISPNTFVCGHLGRLTYPKNQFFLLKIFREIHTLHPDSVLILAGGGERERALRSCAADYGLEDCVCFMGATERAAELYSAMDIFYLPSLYEGMPVAALEAQANGLPCLISNRVTREVGILPTVQFLSLKEPARVWAERGLALAAEKRCPEAAERLDASPFAIKKAAKRLLEIYQALSGISITDN